MFHASVSCVYVKSRCCAASALHRVVQLRKDRQTRIGLITEEIYPAVPAVVSISCTKVDLVCGRMQQLGV